YKRGPQTTPLLRGLGQSREPRIEPLLRNLGCLTAPLLRELGQSVPSMAVRQPTAQPQPRLRRRRAVRLPRGELPTLPACLKLSAGPWSTTTSTSQPLSASAVR